MSRKEDLKKQIRHLKANIVEEAVTERVLILLGVQELQDHLGVREAGKLEKDLRLSLRSQRRLRYNIGQT